jgi:3-phenylpropionate/trans-cinnamate dioxygenase ferredoxin subunit
MSWTKIIRKDAVPVGEVRVATAGDEKLAVCRIAKNEFYVIEDVCPHDDGPLGEGWLEGHAIECPRHGARFDVRTGEVLRMPAATGIKSFAVRLSEDGWVEADLWDGDG